ncbi:MAG: MATE family efflux transporter [Clostridia bacterium]|nr:MATE family efflux transporter [Clostridia bacterium]
MADTFHKDLTQGSVSRQLIKFATPFLLSNLLQALYSVADMIIVGQFCGKTGITGVSIGSQINILVTGAALGLSVGGTVLIAQYGGQKLFKEQRKTIGTMTTLYIILAVVLTVVMLLLCDPLLQLLNTPASAYTEAKNYYNICMGGMVFMFLYNAISGVLRGMGDSKRPLYFVLIAAIANVVLDLLLVGKFGMASAGAAWATISAQALSVVISLIYLAKKKFFEEYKLSDFKISKEKLGPLMRIGLPSSIQSLVVSLSFLTLTALVNSLPNAEVASACQGIGGKINSFAILPGLAISSAISSMAGQNIGAGEFDRAKKTMKIGMVMAFAISVVVFAVVNIFPEFLIRLFDSEPEVIETGARYIRLISFDYLFACIMFCLNGLAIAAGSTYIALINAFCNGILIRVPLAYFLVNVMGLGFDGIALSMGFASLGGIIIGAIYVQSGKWKKSMIN